MMEQNLLLSVVIPTYRRKQSVLRTLRSLNEQTIDPACFEVIVMDDGSAYEVSEVAQHPFTFSLTYLRQENQGATVARNNAVRKSRGEILVFIDDDVTVSPQTLAALVEACSQEDKVLAMGTLVSRSNEPPTPFTRNAIALANHATDGKECRSADQYVHFAQCNTQLLAVKRSDFFALGMLQDPTGGWPNWDDVDFGYRAHLAGFRLLQSANAVGEHWDYSLASLEAACQRWRRASQSAVQLFHVHPGLEKHIPMFRDKGPLMWGQDSPQLITRKVLRRVISLPPPLWLMEQGVKLLESLHPSTRFLPVLYRWIQGNYMFLGYQEGLRQQVRLRKGENV